ncbi:MAG: SRPBCC family protein [Candidatus Dojkabacteria bacterium]
METKSIKQWTDIPASVHEVYEAFLDSKKHAAFTGASAEIDSKVGGEFSVWDGSLHGKTIELIPDEKIVQLWRSEEEGWPKDHFSKITLKFKKNKDGNARILFWQSGIPESTVDNVSQGWKDYYWGPLKKYFSK